MLGKDFDLVAANRQLHLSGIESLLNFVITQPWTTPSIAPQWYRKLVRYSPKSGGKRPSIAPQWYRKKKYPGLKALKLARQLHLSGIERYEKLNWSLARETRQLHLSGIERLKIESYSLSNQVPSIAPQWYRKNLKYFNINFSDVPSIAPQWYRKSPDPEILTVQLDTVNCTSVV